MTSAVEASGGDIANDADTPNADTPQAFGFDDTPGTDIAGFDEETAPGSGGTFTEEI